MTTRSLPLFLENELTHDPVFIARVRAAVTRIAREVLSEPADTPGHPLRTGLARSVLNPADSTTPGLAPSIAADPNISAAAAAAPLPIDGGAAEARITDEQILDAVRQAWDLTAGVGPAPAQ
ncbi:hypothetical protein [Streptomyces sp. NPDC097619]|uniref:hypothetical protein n=1 Tax=Streptomyces sp. NPDC097619 TaxID=3157228 RepID=UPI003320DF6F